MCKIFNHHKPLNQEMHMSGDVRLQAKPTGDLSVVATPSTPAKSTFKGFTYPILKDGLTNHTTLVTTETQFVKAHIPTYNKVLTVLVDTSKDLALKNTDYDARGKDQDQDQLYKDVCGDLRVYRRYQTTFHTQVLAFNIMTRDVTVWVKCLKASPEAITFTRITPSKKEMSLVEQAAHLDTMKKTAYEAAKKGILRQVTSLQKQLTEKLGAYDTEMDKLENTASYIKACLTYGSFNPQRYLAMKYYVELPAVDSPPEEEGEVDVSDFSMLKSYKDVDYEDETPDNKGIPLSESSGSLNDSIALPSPSSGSSTSGSTSASTLPPSSSSSTSDATPLPELPPSSSSSMSGSTPVTNKQAGLSVSSGSSSTNVDKAFLDALPTLVTDEESEDQDGLKIAARHRVVAQQKSTVPTSPKLPQQPSGAPVPPPKGKKPTENIAKEQPTKK